MPGANRVTDLAIGGWQMSTVVNWESGLPFTLTYSGCGGNVPNGPCDPNIIQGEHFQTHLGPFKAGSGGVGTRTYVPAYQLPGESIPGAISGVFYSPGLGNFGNVGQNTAFGPRFFGTDMALTKQFSIWETVAGSFRFDAFNVFNHITAGLPCGSGGCTQTVDTASGGTITSAGEGYGQSQDFGPRQLEFSLRLQF